MKTPLASYTRCTRVLLVFVVLALWIADNSSEASFSVRSLAFAATSSKTSERPRRKENNPPVLIRHRGRVAYDGAGFAGFQVQRDGKRTVQGLLEEVLSRRFNRAVRVVGAGRTDAGVHARAQAFHFDLFLEETEEEEGGLQKLQSSMNSMLTQDVRVWNIARAPPPVSIPIRNGTSSGLIDFPWHSIYNSTQKLYSYRFSNGCVMDPLLRRNRWGIDWDVDIERLDRVLKHFHGTHDFRAFAAAIEQNEKRNGRPISTVRTIDSVELVNEGNGNYRIDILLRGALYKMVRNMVSAAIDVCSKNDRITEDEFLLLLRQEDSTGATHVYTRYDNPCKPAPPNGLTLERVFYDNCTTF